MRRGSGKALWILGAPVRGLLLGLIAIYRAALSGLLGSHCRFHPSCSAYAMESIRIHGAAKGVALTAWRLLRCSPMTAGGLDPVPPQGSWRPGGMSASYGRP